LRTPEAVACVVDGHTTNGHVVRAAMRAFNAGATELQALIMIVVDASEPFSVPATFQ
jgi:hypothetical protein